MMIISISVSGVKQDEDSNQISGSVVMELGHVDTSDRLRAQFLCRVAVTEEAGRDQYLLTLARDALRQARRLPDYADLVENEAFAPQNITLVA